jgi:hypothetical protein
MLRRSLFFWIGLFIISTPSFATDKNIPGEYYEIRVYHFTKAEQEASIDNYLKDAYLPALHKAGFKHIGVFKPVDNDTMPDKRVFVFISSPTLDKLITLPDQLLKDSVYTKAGAAYLNATYDQPPFTRMETILLHSFRLAPAMNLPALKSEKTERIYELRSYEGPTEKLYRTKVKMFNEGGEIPLFKRLNFNAVFYAEVISGSRMPNLMYMTSFENRADREAHWDTFKNDAEWKHLSSLPEYQHTVSKAEIILTRAAAYSDF